MYGFYCSHSCTNAVSDDTTAAASELYDDEIYSFTMLCRLGKKLVVHIGLLLLVFIYSFNKKIKKPHGINVNFIIFNVECKTFFVLLHRSSNTRLA